MGNKGNYEKGAEHVNTNTDNPHKSECESKDNFDTHVLMTTNITYANGVQICHAFFYDKGPIVDIGTLREVITSMH